MFNSREILRWIRPSPVSGICYDNRMPTVVKVKAHNNLKAHLKLLCFDGFLMWISCKQIESCAFRSITKFSEWNWVVESTFWNWNYKHPRLCNKSKILGTTIIITSRPDQVLYFTMPMPYYKKTNQQYMTKDIINIPRKSSLYGAG